MRHSVVFLGHADCLINFSILCRKVEGSKSGEKLDQQVKCCLDVGYSRKRYPLKTSAFSSACSSGDCCCPPAYFKHCATFPGRCTATTLTPITKSEYNSLHALQVDLDLKLDWIEGMPFISFFIHI